VPVKDVARFVAEPIQVSVLVLGAGSLQAMRARSRRGVGRGMAIERRVSAEHAERSPLPPSSTGLSGGLLVLTTDGLVLLAVRAGFIGHRAIDALGRHPLADIHDAGLDVESTRLRVGLAEGRTWEFDVARRDRADAELLVRALGGR
jgi:hypothetical protein